MKKILIGTHNQGKFKEISYLISKKYKKISPVTLKIKSPEETGKTFTSNSRIKVNFFSKFVDYPVISDDSGLCIKALNNKPGIHSARLAKKHGGFKQAMSKIIQLIKNKNKNKKKQNTKAKFICSLTLCLSSKEKITTIGEIYGNISEKMLGKNGFGYDPIFIPTGYKLTFGQMAKKQKMLMDHRFLAFQILKRKIKIL